MTWHEDSIFKQMIQRVVRLPWWLEAFLILGLGAIPFVITYLEQIPPVPAVQGEWRRLLFPTVGIAYIIAVAPAIRWAEQAVAEGLRPLAISPPAANGTRVLWRWSSGDWTAFGVGALVCVLLLVQSAEPVPLYWADRYLTVAHAVMLGALAWLIYAALCSACVTAVLHRTLRPHNPFDLTPFQPIGQQALVLALIFVGAITVSLIFVYTPRLFFDWSSLLIYTVLILTTLSVFFCAMWPAHRTLARVKADERAIVQHLLAQTYARLHGDLQAGAVPPSLTAEFETWLALAQRLDKTPTWPYNLVMLRTLALSVLTPVFVALFRVLGLWLSEGRL